MKDPETEQARLKAELLAAVHAGAANAEADGMDERDRQAIVDEHAFIEHFGFDRPRRDREGLIRLKHAKDITDREIRFLKFTSSLRFGADGAHLSASRAIAVFGRALMCTLALQMVYAWALAARSSEPAPILALKLAAVAIVLMGTSWIVHQLYVRAWLIQQRTLERERI